MARRAHLASELLAFRRFSIVIPTFQRRALVLASVQALARQEYDRFEVIVVVDGSDDGSAEALRQERLPYPLKVLEQRNEGAAAARNRGAAEAVGDTLLFLDDDMEADPRLLLEHQTSYEAGADAVLGHLPLHPESPDTFLSRGVKRWTDKRLERLIVPGARLSLHDLLTGQFSIRRSLFQQIGGFDADFTRNGSFGDEDVDLGLRLLSGGYRIVFNPRAISWQRYIVTPRRHLQQWREAGRADVVFARKHPAEAAALFELHHLNRAMNRRVWRPLVAVPMIGRAVSDGLRQLALALAELRPRGERTARVFFRIRDLEYWRGVHEAGGIPRPRPLRVLAYHAIRDLVTSSALKPYGVPGHRLRAHLDLLQSLGFRFVTADECLRAVRGEAGLPRKPVLLTFDDCYVDLLTTALPLLKERGIPAVAFAVSGRLGGVNDWDQRIAAPLLRLMNASELIEASRHGIEIGAHSQTHQRLTRVPLEVASREVSGAIRDLVQVGLGPVRLLAYPYGEHNPEVRRIAASAGFEAAFTITSGVIRPGDDPFQLPRIELLRQDGPVRLLWKLVVAARFGR